MVSIGMLNHQNGYKSMSGRETALTGKWFKVLLTRGVAHCTLQTMTELIPGELGLSLRCQVLTKLLRKA